MGPFRPLLTTGLWVHLLDAVWFKATFCGVDTRVIPGCLPLSKLGDVCCMMLALPKTNSKFTPENQWGENKKSENGMPSFQSLKEPSRLWVGNLLNKNHTGSER